ncbi:MAG: flagellar protein FlgN [Clostridiales bacterium]|nr:flagellar protein FlgN [Bacillota bacterium]NLK03405.1 flagellar protein FlgN [Clostridiales bacterium]
MASLIDELINVLEGELEIYNQLIPIVREKSQVIVKNDTETLQEITAKEQAAIDQITGLENKRVRVMKDISIVLGKKDESLNLSDLIKLLGQQEKEQRALSLLHDRFKETVNTLVEINNRNKSLIQQSLEMIEFNMNFLQSTRMSPGNNTYTKSASQDSEGSMQTGMFDAKQ